MPEVLLFGRVHWPFADPNSLAGLTALGFFFAFGLMLGGRSRLQSNAGLILAILTAGALLVTGSRGGLIGVLAGLFVLTALAMPQARKHVRCLFIFAAATGVILWATHNAAPAVAEDARDRIAATIRGETPVLWTRPAIWEGTQKIIDGNLWIGTGIGTFYLYYPEVRLEGDPRSAGRMAHSDPLQFWAEMGVFSPLLFYAFIVLAVILTVRALMILPPQDDRRIHILAPFCGLWALVLHTHITFHFYIFPILMMAGIMVGYWFRQVREVSDDSFLRVPALKLPSSETLKILIILPMLAGTYWFAMLQSSHIMINRAESKLLAGDFDGFGRDLNVAGRMAQGQNDLAFLTAAKVKLATLQTLGGIPDPGAEEIYTSGLAQIDAAQELNPRSAVVPYLRAEYARAAGLLGLAKQGDPEEFLKASLKLNPVFYAPRIALAELYLRQNKDAEAYAVMKEGMKWREAARVPIEYYDLMARLALGAGDNHARDVSMKMLLTTQRKTREKAGKPE